MKLPDGMTKKQLELLILITRGPVGKGLTMVEAAKELKITYRAAQYRLASFKKTFPDAYKNWKMLRDKSQWLRKVLRNEVECREFYENNKFGDYCKLYIKDYLDSTYDNPRHDQYNPIKEKF